MKAVTEEATDMIETSYSTASKGASDYGMALIDVARANTNATFDFYSQIMTVKSLSEMIELVDLARPQAVRDCHRAVEGSDGAGTEGGYRSRSSRSSPA